MHSTPLETSPGECPRWKGYHGARVPHRTHLPPFQHSSLSKDKASSPEKRERKDSEVVLVNKPSIPWRHYLWRCQNKLSADSDDHDKATNNVAQVRISKKCHHYSASGMFENYKSVHPFNKGISNYMESDYVKNYLKMKGIFQSSKSLSVEDFRSLGHGVKVSEEVENEYCEEKSVSLRSSENMRVNPLDTCLVAKAKRKRCLHRKCNAGLFYSFNTRRCLANENSSSEH